MDTVSISIGERVKHLRMEKHEGIQKGEFAN